MTTTNLKCCIVRQSESTGKKTIFRNCDTIEDAVSTMKNQTFKNCPIWNGDGLSFTAHTPNNLYFIIEGHHRTI